MNELLVFKVPSGSAPPTSPVFLALSGWLVTSCCGIERNSPKAWGLVGSPQQDSLYHRIFVGRTFSKLFSPALSFTSVTFYKNVSPVRAALSFLVRALSSALKICLTHSFQCSAIICETELSEHRSQSRTQAGEGKSRMKRTQFPFKRSSQCLGANRFENK